MTATSGLAAPITRLAAQRAATAELRKRIYHRHATALDTWTLTVLRWLGRRYDDATHHAPGGAAGLVGLLVVVILVAVLVRHRIGPVARTARSSAPVSLDRRLRAADYRAAAEHAAASGEWMAAVRERMRAVAAELSERGAIDARPGHTADEIAAQAGQAVPALAGALRVAAGTFDAVWYGGRPAGPEAYARIVAADMGK